MRGEAKEGSCTQMKALASLKRRPILFIASILITTSLFCFSTFALNIAKSDLSVYEKSDGVIVDNSETIEENGVITPAITFSQLGDFITYKLTLSDNDNSAYQIINISDNNTNENITTSYSYDNAASDSNKDVYITLTYAQELTGDLNLTNFEVTIDYQEITPTSNDDNNNDEEEIDVPYTGTTTDDNSNTPNTNTPNTGSQTLSKTFSLETPNQNHNITKTILIVALVCVLASLSYLLFRKLHKSKSFNLEKKSHSHQIPNNFTGLIIAGLIITGGAIGVTHATNASNLVLSFNLSKVKITITPTATRTVQFIANSSNANVSTDNNTKTCDLYFNDITCGITLPSFTTTSGYEILGWNTNANAHEALYQPGETIAFSADTTLYTITRKSLLASFINQHDNYFTISKESDSCYIYNNETNCSIATPTANKISPTSGSEFLGWSTNSEALVPETPAGTSFAISENTAMYSVASIPATTISIRFINNDSSGVTNISETTKSCTMIDEESSCNIVIPDFTVASDYTKIGWNSNSNAKLAEYLPGQEVSFQTSATYYTISKTTFTASFTNQHTDYFTTSASTVSCDAYNGATSCQVTTPTAIATTLGQTKEATFLGWSNDNEASSASYMAGGTISVTNNEHLYSVVNIPPTYYSYEVYFVNQDPDGISQISQESVTCTLPENETECNITLPTITTNPGYEALGWSKSLNSTYVSYYENQTTTVHNSTTFYTISRKTLTATFTNLHTDYFNISSSSESCYVYNGANSCTVISPTITKLTDDDDTTFLGWNTNSDTQTGMETSSSIVIYDSTTYYSIAKVPTDTTYSLKFANDLWQTSTPLSYFSSTENCIDTSESDCIEIEENCTVYTWESSCTIIAPNFNIKSEWETEWEAYGYDTIRPARFIDPSYGTNNFVEIGDSIIVTNDNNNQIYYSIIKSQNYITATFTNQHTAYNFIASSDSESCYMFNNKDYCYITTPSLTQEQPNDNITKIAWSKSSSKYSNEQNPGESIIIDKNTKFYSAVSGIPYTITFDKNVNFGESNFAADSLSFYSTECTVTKSGCYISNMPRIYSTGNAVGGFETISQYSNNISRNENLLEHDFTANTTVYAHVFNMHNITASFDINRVRKIYQPNNATEYYQVDFDNDLEEELIQEYGNYIEGVFTKAPQLHVLQGKMRFLSRDHYEAKYDEGTLMITATKYGLYAPIDASPWVSNATDPYTKSGIVHELGHALDAAWGDLYGKRLAHQQDFFNLYNTYKEAHDAYVENHGEFIANDTVPLRAYSYSDPVEFFADAFTVWYGNKVYTEEEKETEMSESFGSISEDISNTLYNYLCNTNYTKIPNITSAEVCVNNNQ